MDGGLVKVNSFRTLRIAALFRYVWPRRVKPICMIFRYLKRQAMAERDTLVEDEAIPPPFAARLRDLLKIPQNPAIELEYLG